MDILDRLSCYNKESEQLNAIQEILNDPSFDYRVLVFPSYGKNSWENCAYILSTLDDDKLIPFMPKLFEWFKDLNWPGAEAICERLHQMPFAKLKPYYLEACEQARIEADEMWLYFLEEEFKLTNS